MSLAHYFSNPRCILIRALNAKAGTTKKIGPDLMPGSVVRKPNTAVVESALECPFCSGKHWSLAFHRKDHIFHRCHSCAARVQLRPVIQPHWESYESGEFANRITSELGTRPDFAKLSEIRRYLTGDSLLEIGPGTGHLLAAAAAEGFRVAGIDLSPANREFIRHTWGIDTFSVPIEANELPANSYSNVVSFNCLEHIRDVRAHLAAVARVLVPGGRFFVSTCNANALAARIVRKWWSMYGTEDHVCIPTATSLREVGTQAGLRPLRIWSSEYPLETPAGLVVALRAWMCERNSSRPRETIFGPALSAETSPSVARKLIKSRWFAPIGNAIAAAGLGGSIKALYCKSCAS